MAQIPLSYVPADPERDVEFACQVHHVVYKDIVIRQFGSWDEKIQDGFFAEKWNQTPHQIVLLSGKPIGVVSIVRKVDHIFLSEIQILQEYQGRGIGTQIITEQIERSRDSGLPLRLQVLRLNKAQDLYRRLGFSVASTTDTHVMMEWADNSRRG